MIAVTFTPTQSPMQCIHLHPTNQLPGWWPWKSHRNTAECYIDITGWHNSTQCVMTNLVMWRNSHSSNFHFHTSSNANANSGHLFYKWEVRIYCTGLGQLNDCYNSYFLKAIKSVFVLVQCNTPLSKNYVAVVCVTDWIWEKKLVCMHSLGCLCIWNQL